MAHEDLCNAKLASLGEELETVQTEYKKIVEESNALNEKQNELRQKAIVCEQQAIGLNRAITELQQIRDINTEVKEG
tara:strand:+ start:4531 stop:4761 length:231 start_codon:yes stop_codon:yes gene_type:complete